MFLKLTLTLFLAATQVQTQLYRPARQRCEKPENIPNGSYNLRRSLVRVQCDPGYILQGYKVIGCFRGKWDAEKPVCAKKGCQTNDLESVVNGRIQIENDVKMILYCSDNYSLAGNRHAYCNGTNWDRPIGSCREQPNKVQHECDFETDDICGWVFEARQGLEWKRVMAANVFTTFKTGPQHDHTTLKANGGHYMLMESLQRSTMPITLTSPIYDRELSLKTACCFRFYYFMYGSGVGDLFVVVKPLSVTLDEIFLARKELIKFQKYGNQNNIWNEAYFNIEELAEDFQIVFVAKSGSGKLSDIAIDDVKLMTGEECKSLNEESKEDTESTTYESIFDIQSCAHRCDEPADGVLRKYGHLFGLCGCDEECENNNSCCPDYKTACSDDETTTIIAEVAVTSDLNNASEQQDTDVNPKALAITNSSTSTTTTTTTTSTSTTTTTTPKPTKTTTKTVPKTTTTITTTTTTTTTTPKSTSKLTTKATTITPTNATTPKITTKTTPALTTKTTPTTKTTSTTKPTPTTTTTSTTTTTTAMRTTAKTNITKPTTKKIIITTPATTSISTSTPKPLSTSTAKVSITTKTATTTSASTSINHNENTTKISKDSNAPQIIIDNSRIKQEAAHKGSRVMLWLFLAIVVVIAASLAYRRCGDRARYLIHFKKSQNGDEETSSIAAVNISDHLNGKSSDKRKGKLPKKPKKYSNDLKSPLVDDNDDDDEFDDNFGGNGNIALSKNIYTEL